jgi:hypothetical protein
MNLNRKLIKIKIKLLMKKMENKKFMKLVILKEIKKKN